MKENSEERYEIKKYLLGILTDEGKMRLIEERLLMDEDFAEELSIAENDLIESYLDGTLSDDERIRFKSFFLVNSERKEKLRLVKNLQKYADRQQPDEKIAPQKKSSGFDWRVFFASPVFRFAAALILFCAAGAAIWRLAIYESDTDKGLAQLQTAFRGQRPTESRSTAQTDYAPFTVTRGNAAPAAAEKARSRAERYLLDATENSVDARAHHALGLLYFNEKKFDEALREFEIALKITPDDAKLQSDLGALYLEKAEIAETLENGEEFFKNADSALRHLNRALEIDPNQVEALFNKALLLQKMGITNQAVEAWEKYLEKDSSSPWADEARRNLEILKQQSLAPKPKEQILQDFLQAFRNRDDERAWEIVSQTKELVTGIMVSQQLAQRFLELEKESDRKDEQTEILSAFLYLGELEKKKTGDPFFIETAEFYSRSNAAQRRKMLAASIEFRKGHEHLLEANWQPALESFINAQKNYQAARDKFDAQTVEYQICYVLSRVDRISYSSERLLKLAETAEKKNYKWVKSLAYNWLGGNYDLLGENTKALEYNRKLRETAEESGDRYALKRAFDQMTIGYRTLGDGEKSFKASFQSLSLRNSYHTFLRQQWRTVSYALENCYRFRLYEAAAAFAREELELAVGKLKDKWMSFSVYKDLALIYADLNKHELSLQNIEAAKTIAQTFNDEEMKQSLLAEIQMTEGNVYRNAGDCLRAIEHYETAVSIYEKMEFSVYNYEAQKGRLLCYARMENDAMMREKTPEILNLFERNRQKIEDEELENVFFDNEQNVYDIAAGYAYSRLNDSEQAFNYAESSRARGLLEKIGGKDAKPLTLADFKNKIPPEAQTLYYAVLQDKILIWLITAGETRTFETRINTAELNEKAGAFIKNLNGGDNAEKFGSQLYEMLIAPAEKFLQKDKPICIIADKILFRVPFAALKSPLDKKYLIESYPVFYSYSASVLIAATTLADEKKGSEEFVLSLGNPAFSRKNYPGLEPLPGARAEAETVSGFYPKAKTFVGADAGKENFFRHLEKADVVHFAGHYVPNLKFPQRSEFLLAQENGGSGGSVKVEEFKDRDFSKTRLMVLSACETGIEKIWNGEGMIGAAREFLAFGVPSVVASQWAVDSVATSRLMINFHRLRKQNNFSTAEALRRAQIEMLYDKQTLYRSPFYWAGFSPIGGFTKY